MCSLEDKQVTPDVWTAKGERQFICVNFGSTCAFLSTVSEGGLIRPGKEEKIDRSVADIGDEKAL